MFDACYQAKRTREMLPPLPEGVRSSFIQYLDTIQSLEGQGVQVKVSDISDAMELPRPGVTRTVKEMEEKGYLKKMASEADGRVTYIAVTRKGTNLSQKYDEQYFKSLPLHGRNLGRRCRMYDTDDREILSDHVRKEKTLR